MTLFCRTMAGLGPQGWRSRCWSPKSGDGPWAGRLPASPFIPPASGSAAAPRLPYRRRRRGLSAPTPRARLTSAAGQLEHKGPRARGFRIPRSGRSPEGRVSSRRRELGRISGRSAGGVCVCAANVAGRRAR